MDYFFYGTLMDADLRARVAGGPGALAGEPARVEGYARVNVAGTSYPMLVPRPGGRVEGCLVRRVDGRQSARLARFEGAGYELRVLAVQTAGGPALARTFMARPGVRASTRPWELDSWRRRFKPLYLKQAAAGRRRPASTAAGRRALHGRGAGGVSKG